MLQLIASFCRWNDEKNRGEADRRKRRAGGGLIVRCFLKIIVFRAKQAVWGQKQGNAGITGGRRTAVGEVSTSFISNKIGSNQAEKYKKQWKIPLGESCGFLPQWCVGKEEHSATQNRLCTFTPIHNWCFKNDEWAISWASKVYCHFQALILF